MLQTGLNDRIISALGLDGKMSNFLRTPAPESPLPKVAQAIHMIWVLIMPVLSEWQCACATTAGQTSRLLFTNAQDIASIRSENMLSTSKD